MASQNFFALLGDDENDDPSDLLAQARAAALPPSSTKKPQLQQQRSHQQLPPPAPAKLPSKPLPPAQAVKETQANGARGRGIRGGRGAARGSSANRGRGFEGGFNQSNRGGAFQGEGGDNNDRSYRNGGDFPSGRGSYLGGGPALNGDLTSPGDEGESGRQYDGRPRPRGRGRGRGFGFMADGDEQPRPRREYERRSGTGRGNEMKREGSGRGNWGVEVDQDAAQEIVETVAVEDVKPAVSNLSEKKPEDSPQPDSTDKDENKEVEEEDKEMTLDEYEQLMTEKRKALEFAKAKERKVTVDKDFESMQIVDRKIDEDIFLKLGSDKDKGKRKEILDSIERARKPLSINEFLKPAEGEDSYYSPNGRRGRGGRGRSDRGGARGGFGGGHGVSQQALMAPRIEDPGQFPTLGGK